MDHDEFVISNLARMTLMDRENKMIEHLGNDNTAKQVCASARRVLRSRGQCFRGRVGGSDPSLVPTAGAGQAPDRAELQAAKILKKSGAAR